MRITERYSSAIKSSNLKSVEATTYSDSDVIGAYGLASKKHPLAVALTRLLAGDNHASGQVVEILSQMTRDRAGRTGVTLLVHTQAVDIARAVLAWYRNGTCTACGGHGYEVLPGTPSLSNVECGACKGTGKILFDRQFPHQQRALATWLLNQVETQLSTAGPAAMAMLAPRLEM
jgi:hypothetical protein